MRFVDFVRIIIELEFRRSVIRTGETVSGKAGQKCLFQASVGIRGNAVRELD